MRTSCGVYYYWDIRDTCMMYALRGRDCGTLSHRHEEPKQISTVGGAGAGGTPLPRLRSPVDKLLVALEMGSLRGLWSTELSSSKGMFGRFSYMFGSCSVCSVVCYVNSTRVCFATDMNYSSYV